MYDFKHSINDNQRYNIYESYNDEIDKDDTYLSLRNGLTLITILLIVFMLSVFSLKFYQKHNSISKTYVHQNLSNTAQDEYTNFELNKAISNSIVQNLQSQQTLKHLNDIELKHIITSVVNKIENEPSKFIYMQN